MGFRITSPDFEDNGQMPGQSSCEGGDISPELSWEDPPSGTKGYALVVEDPDAPGGTFTHWIVFDMPAAMQGLRRGFGIDQRIKNGLKTGMTDFGHAGYGGPCPPRGRGRHRYNFILTALDVGALGVRNGAGRSAVEKAMKGHILGQTRITGVYERR